MKVGAFLKVLGAAEQLQRASGNEAIADALKSVSGLLAGRETMNVSAVASLLASVEDVEEASLNR